MKSAGACELRIPDTRLAAPGRSLSFGRVGPALLDGRLMKTMIVAAGVIAVLSAAAPASAEKPVRGCPDDFKRFTSEQIFAMFPNVTQNAFDFVDKNGDGIICGKQLRPIFNPIDNTANRP